METFRPALSRMMARARAITIVTAAAAVVLDSNILQQACAAMGATADSSMIDLVWVASHPQEGHAEACARHGLNPSDAVVYLSPPPSPKTDDVVDQV